LDGDIGYFSHFESSQAQRSLRAVKEIFEKLQTLYQQLAGLQESCQNLTKGVSMATLFTISLPETSSADEYS